METKNKQPKSINPKSEIIVIDGFAKIKKENIITTFGSKSKIKAMTDKYRHDQLAEIPDLTKKTGRDRIASRAYAVSRKKNQIVDDVIEPSIKEHKELIKKTNEGKKFFISEMDLTRDEIRKPLNEWETKEKEKEKKRISDIQEKINSIVQLGFLPIDFDKEYVESMIDAVENIDCTIGFDEFTQDALQVKSSAKENLSKILNELIKKELEEQQQKLLLEQQLKLDKQKEALELKAKAQERLNKLIMIPSTMFDKTSKEVDQKIQSIVNLEIKEDEFGELKNEAVNAVDQVLMQLKTIYGQKLIIEKSQKEEKIKQDELAKTKPQEIEKPLNSNLDVPQDKDQSVPQINMQTPFYGEPSGTFLRTSSRLKETFKNVSDRVQEKTLPTGIDIESFIGIALDFKDQRHNGLIEDFCCLLISDDPQLNNVAMGILRKKFKIHFSNK